MNRLFLGWMILVLLLWCGPALAQDTVCVQCHGGLDGRLGAPVGQWEKSIHAANGISCHDCHGGDPSDFAMAMSPERGFIGVPGYEEVPAFCGRCHLGVREDYEKSAHGEALANGGPNCVICHGNHEVVKASIDLINEQDCTRCHDYERAAEVKGVIAETEAKLQSLDLSVASLHRVGIDVERLSGELFSTRNQFRRLFHTVNVEKLQQQRSAFDSDLAEIGAQVGEIENQLSQRKLIGGIIVVLLVLAGCVALLIRQTYHSEEEAGE
ncbi:MAG: cytochrome C [Desulfuromonas sp.]|nr:MAG: cytochrome C [Desulfuromonas sp.]